LGIHEPQHEVGAYEAGGAGDEEGLGVIWHVIHLDAFLKFPAELTIDREHTRTSLSYPGNGLGPGSRTHAHM
jgi:hypothetical protein